MGHATAGNPADQAPPDPLATRIRNAWLGRISGCQLGKPVELLSMLEGFDAVERYLAGVGALPLRDYVPLGEHPAVRAEARSCRDHLTRAEPDDDINYTYLGLHLLEQHGPDLTTEDVARAWLKLLPAASTFTAERAAYATLLSRMDEWFPEGADVGFDLLECADNPYNDWIGAQIRADLYGWVCPGNAPLAAELARRDAALSHRGDGIDGAVFVAAVGAEIPVSPTFEEAAERALARLPADSGAAAAVRVGLGAAGPGGDAAIRAHFADVSPLHTDNNLALVVWALATHPDDFDAAIGDVVAAGWDTDCNGATVGGLWGLQGRPIPEHWWAPWHGRVGLSLAGLSEVDVDDLIERTVRVAETMPSAG